MAIQMLQQILCRCTVDRGFLGTVLTDPQQVLEEYDLSHDEYSVLTGARARSLMDLAVAVEAWRRGEIVAQPVHQFALAG